ncbi:hypothetical protein JCM1840_005588 [Sporobolomyces johnsonii]
MLPWNPPSSFSLGGGGGDPSLQPRYPYDQQQPNHLPQQQQQPQPQQQQPQLQQQQQQQQQPQPQQQQQQQPPNPAACAYPPMTLASTLHFLQSEHRRYARDRNEWEIERAEMRARIALLEGEKRGNEGALKSLGRRCKMLEMALRGERSKFLSTTNALAGSTPSVSGTASPIPGAAPSLTATNTTTGKEGTTAGGIPPGKLASLQKESITSGDAKSSAMAPSSSSPGTGAPTVNIQPPTGGLAAHGRTDSSASLNGFATGTWGPGATLGGPGGGIGGRDPRGKARSREYLKQCLQEITYLTSSTTLNPLSTTSYAAPQVPRPRKVLPDHVPSVVSGPGMLNLGTSAAEESAAPAPAPAPAPAAPAPAASSPPAAAKPPSNPSLLTSFPSDPPSAYVPLKRQISTPGQPGPRARGDSGEKKKPEEKEGDKGEAQDEMDKAIEEMSRSDAPAEKKEVEAEPTPPPVVDEDKAEPAPAPASTAVEDPAAPAVDEPAAEPEEEHDPFEPVAESSVPAASHQAAQDEAKRELVADDDQAELAGAEAEPVPESAAVEEEPVKTEEQEQAKEEEQGSTLPSARDIFARTDSSINAVGGGNGGGVGMTGPSSGSGGTGARAGGEAKQAVTAIYRPSGSGSDEWRAKLEAAGRRAYPGFSVSSSSSSSAVGDRELEALSAWDLEEPDEEDEDEGEGGGKKDKRKKRKQPSETGLVVGLKEDERWKSTRVLRSHLEAVRAVCAGEGGEVVTAADDCTVKVWRGAFDTGGGRSSRSELEPTITYRGHTAPITSVAVSRSSDTILSASLDSTIRLWAVPPPSHEIYSAYDPSLELGTIEPAGNAVWGLALLSGEGEGEETLACITADGSIQLWALPSRELVRRWTWTWTDAEREGSSGRKKKLQAPIPTAVTTARVEGREVLVVAWQNAAVKVYEPTTGEEVTRLKGAEESSDGTPETQINALAAHPTLPLLATAHEDRFIRIFDLSTNTCLVSTLAHLDGVTSLSFSPSSAPSAGDEILLASVSHDTSLRLWHLCVPSSSSPDAGEATLTCVQEVSSHRVKGAEGVLAVAFAPEGTGERVVTAGADGSVRVWEK